MRFVGKCWLLCGVLLLVVGLDAVIAQAPPPPPDVPPAIDPVPPPPPIQVSPSDSKPKPPATKPAADSSQEKAPGLIVVHVPENAVIWFGDQKMTQTGTKRTFQSPPLEPGKNYFYAMKIARPNPTAGQPDTVSEHEVGVAPNQTTEVNFLKPGEGVVVTPGQIYTPPRRILPPLFRPSEGSGYR